MNWYLAKVVFRIICGEGLHNAQFDEQLRLISAEDQQQAFEKAKALGKQEEETFYNKQKKLVQWKFVGVAEAYPLVDMIDGAELYSKIQEPEDAESYTRTVRRKEAQLESTEVPKIFQLLRECVLL